MSSKDVKFTPSSVDVFADYFGASKRPTRVAAVGGKVRIASVDQLVGMTRVSADVLVRHAQQDFWQIGQDEDGFFIERLVDDASGPVRG